MAVGFLKSTIQAALERMDDQQLKKWKEGEGEKEGAEGTT